MECEVANGSYAPSSQSISSMVGGLEELDCIIRRMILDSYSLLAEDIIPCKYLVRGTKYKAPSMGDYSMGLYAHTDKYLLTILAEEQVRGLEVLSKDGQWIPLSPSPNSFVVLVGDLFMVSLSLATSFTSKFHPLQLNIFMLVLMLLLAATTTLLSNLSHLF